MNFTSTRAQSGFIQGAVLFGLLVLSLVVGAFALANRGSPQKVTTEQDKVNAAVILKQVSDIVSALDRYGATGDLVEVFGGRPGSGFSNVTVGQALFDSSIGSSLASSNPPTSAFDTSSNAYQAVASGGLGASFNPMTYLFDADQYAGMSPSGQDLGSYAIGVFGLTQGVCNQINKSLLGRDISQTPFSSSDIPINTPWPTACYTEDGFGSVLIFFYGNKVVRP